MHSVCITGKDIQIVWLSFELTSCHLLLLATIISLILHLRHPSFSHNPESDQVFNYQGSLLLRGASRDFLKEAPARNDS